MISNVELDIESAVVLDLSEKINPNLRQATEHLMLRDDDMLRSFDKDGFLQSKFIGLNMRALVFVNQNYILFTMNEVTPGNPILFGGS